MAALPPAYIQVGDFKIDARPFVMAAINRYGTIRPERAEDFLQAFVEANAAGTGSRGICEAGCKLTWPERKERGLERGAITWEALSLLTDEAGVNPYDAIFAVWHHAAGFVRRAWRILALKSIMADKGPFARPGYVRFLVEDGRECCATASQTNGRVLEWNDDMVLPLPGCSSDTCCCDFELLTGRRYMEHRAGLKPADE